MEYKQILDPKPDTIVHHRGWMQNTTDYPCDVFITKGNYQVAGRVSNYWYWHRMLPDGTMNPLVEHGYGDFEEAHDFEAKVELVKKIEIINKRG